MIKAIFSPSALAVLGLLMMSSVVLNASTKENNTTKAVTESAQTQDQAAKTEAKKAAKTEAKKD